MWFPKDNTPCSNKLEVPTGLSPSLGTSWGMGETQAEGELQNRLNESSGTTCLKYPEMRYSFRGAAEGREGEGKKTIPPQCTRSKLRLLQRTCFHQTSPICKRDKSADGTRYKHCQTWNPHHQESGQPIRETCGVFMPLKFTQVGPSSMISYGEVDGSSPCIPEDEEDGTSTLLPICASVWTTPTTRKPSTRYQGCSSNSLQ